MFLRCSARALRQRGALARIPVDVRAGFASSSDMNPNKVSGFSFPAPRVLNEIAKVELLRAEEPEAIKRIWGEHHAASDSALATTLSREEYEQLMPRTRER